MAVKWKIKIPLLWKFAIVVFMLFLADYVGLFVHFFELDYTRYFELPVVDENAATGNANNAKINHYYDYQFIQKALNKCTTGAAAPHLTVLVKSALTHEDRRNIIRRTWGYERRFSDVNFRCVFLLGRIENDEATMSAVRDESAKHNDIVQGDFMDTYYNNTIKTMLGIRWAKEYCMGSDYYMFVDDDFYVSIKNILKYIAYPELYPNSISGLWSQRQHMQKSQEPGSERLFAGNVMHTAPMRQKFSKWYISLSEYPFDMWPPYITAGAYVLSNAALSDLYTVGKRTQPFRFDDIFLGVLALVAKLKLTDCDLFYIDRPKYSGPESYRFVLASHGFDDGEELEKVWTECRAAGYA